MSDLIKRVEAASGPDREIDRDIALAVCRGAKPIDQDVRISVWDGNGRTKLTVKPYTASLDAALLLVPTECRFNLNKRPFADGRADGYHAQVWYSRYYETADDMPNAWAATPALALCAASLKARSDCLARYGEDIFGDGK